MDLCKDYGLILLNFFVLHEMVFKFCHMCVIDVSKEAYKLYVPTSTIASIDSRD